MPVLVTLAAAGLSALFLLNLRFVIPPVRHSLAALFAAAQEAAGRGGFYLALLHLASSLIPVAAYYSQIAGIFDRSLPLRVFYQRTRDASSIAVALQIECLVAILVVELILFPVLWSPFLGQLTGHQLGHLAGFKLLLAGLAALAATLVLALRQFSQGRGGEWAKWFAVLGYYGLVAGLILETRRFLGQPSPDHPLALILRTVRILVSGEAPWLQLTMHALLWPFLLPISAMTLGRAIRKHGL